MNRSEQAKRGAMLSFRKGRPVTAIAVVALVGTILAAVSMSESPTVVQRAMVIISAVLVFGFSRRIIAGDRSNGRWWLLFQRSVSPLGHYSRLVGVAGACILGGEVVAALALGVATASAGGEMGIVWGSLAGAIVWSLCVYSAGVGISALVRDNDFELLILYYLVSAGQAFIVDLLGIGRGLSTFLSWFLIPIDSIFLLWEWFVTSTWSLDLPDLAQIVVFIVGWLVIAAARVRSDTFGEVS